MSTIMLISSIAGIVLLINVLVIVLLYRRPGADGLVRDQHSPYKLPAKTPRQYAIEHLQRGGLVMVRGANNLEYRMVSVDQGGDYEAVLATAEKLLDGPITYQEIVTS